MGSNRLSEWWHQLSNRERWMVLGGGIIGAILLFYFYVWSPLNARIENLGQQNQSQQALLVWMQHAASEVERYRSSGIKPIHKTQQPLLVFAEKSLSQANLSQYLNQVQQPQSDQLQLGFNTIPFDELTSWLQQLWQNAQISVQQLSVKATSTPGLVHAEVILKKAYSRAA